MRNGYFWGKNWTHFSIILKEFFSTKKRAKSRYPTMGYKYVTLNSGMLFVITRHLHSCSMKSRNSLIDLDVCVLSWPEIYRLFNVICLFVGLLLVKRVLIDLLDWNWTTFRPYLDNIKKRRDKTNSKTKDSNNFVPSFCPFTSGIGFGIGFVLPFFYVV